MASSFPSVSPVPFSKVVWVCLVLIHIVCPLLFYTNLTRNPYFTQITLLYLFVAACGFFWGLEAFKSGEIRIPIMGFEKPLALFLGVALISVILSWATHPFLRAGIAFEGLRMWIFTLVNSVMAAYLPLLYVKPVSESKKSLSIWPDIFCALIWSAMWYPYSSMKSADPSSMFDMYGFILWSAALIYGLVRTKDREAQAFFHVIFSISIVAGLYGISQYAGRDVIWSNPVTPYGGRPVSSFGNPNFLSSYLLLVCPLAVSFALAKEKWEAAGYYFVAGLSIISILCTLTRSTYVGLLASFIFLGVLVVKSENVKSLSKVAGWAALLILLIFIFPGSPVSKIQSPLARFTEIFTAMKTGETYGPWHQRILIWSSAWEMVKERVLFGKGWGCFELFYPFYQGQFLFSDMFAKWRTHANNAHNIVMEIWAQTGILGLGASLLLFTTMGIGGWRVVKQKTEGLSQFVAAGLLAGWLGMVVDNFFGNVSIFFAMPAFLFWWYAGSIFNEASAIKVINRPVEGLGKKTGISLMMTFCLFVMVYYGFRWKQEVAYFQGFKQSKTGQIRESIKSLEKAYEWFPGEVNTNYELGNSYARVAKELSDKGLQGEGRKYIEKAAGAFTAALNANPGYDEIYFNLGVTQIQLGKTQEGIDNLRVAVLINPLMKGAYGSLSTQYVQQKKWPEARTILEQSVRAFPRERDFWNNLSYVYSEMGEDQKGFEASKKAVQIDPTFKTAWDNFHSLRSKLKLQDSLTEMPGLLLKLTNLINEKRFSEARRPAEELVKLIPDNLDVGLSYANILFYLGDVPAAIVEYERLIKIDPNFVAAELNLGRVYVAQKDYKLARLHLTKAYDITPADPEIKQAIAALP